MGDRSAKARVLAVLRSSLERRGIPVHIIKRILAGGGCNKIAETGGACGGPFATVFANRVRLRDLAVNPSSAVTKCRARKGRIQTTISPELWLALRGRIRFHGICAPRLAETRLTMLARVMNSSVHQAGGSKGTPLVLKHRSMTMTWHTRLSGMALIAISSLPSMAIAGNRVPLDFAFGENGSWIVIYESNGRVIARHSNIMSGLGDYFDTINAEGKTPTGVGMDGKAGWVVSSKYSGGRVIKGQNVFAAVKERITQLRGRLDDQRRRSHESGRLRHTLCRGKQLSKRLRHVKHTSRSRREA